MLSLEAAPVEVQETDEERLVDVNRSYYPRKIDTTKTTKPWLLVDAEGQTLGRMASLIAVMIR